jgi:hypothetical protein
MAYLAAATVVPTTVREESPQHQLAGVRKEDLEMSSYGLMSRASNMGAPGTEAWSLDEAALYPPGERELR